MDFEMYDSSVGDKTIYVGVGEGILDKLVLLLYKAM